eukprot:CAMPEP_0115079578 /NCGR_PEP_ID=MMETSP0227-20121206/18190_1 /TAXON_ID=89957 /ORGANISM="Polarella glacialis, Strain CCMP 1383" /LENGTH=138 /DNA_ID=CAMNT_0002467105 /DNA_START=89 /DNA_END=502 /DNA_ORIENTATION=-
MELDSDEPLGAGDVSIPPITSWSFPLTQPEKMQRLLHLFEAELENRDNDIDALQRENTVLRTSLAAAQSKLSSQAEPSTTSGCSQSALVEATLGGSACGGGTCTLRGAPEQIRAVLESLGITDGTHNSNNNNNNNNNS